jgi:hypothetical protein
MSEPSSGVPEEIADAEVQAGEVQGGAEKASEAPAEVDLDLDEEKLEKWDEVKSDYQIDPDGKPMPNIWDAGDVGEGEPEHEADADQREQVKNEDAPEVFATGSDESRRQDVEET